MKYLFEALEARFMSFSTLRRVGRRLYEGFDDREKLNVVKPYTEVSAELSERLDTWDADIETWDLRFRYYAKDLKTNAADDWIEAMTTAFKDANIKAGTFTCAGCSMISATAPRYGDNVFNASARFRLIIQRTLLSPLTRGL